MWLARRRIQALNQAYADLARIEGEDLAAAGSDAAAMAREAFGPQDHG